jgi:hypothetical protein
MTEGNPTGRAYDGANRSPNDDEPLPGEQPAGDRVGAAPEPPSRTAQHGGMADQPGTGSEQPDRGLPEDAGSPGSRESEPTTGQPR